MGSTKTIGRELDEILELKYKKRIMYVRLERPRYLRKENLNKLYIEESVREMINLRCDNTEEGNKYWLDEESVMYILWRKRVELCKSLCEEML